MADGGLPALPAPQPPLFVPPAPPIQQSVPLIQLVVPPAQPMPTQHIQPAHILLLNWLQFKPEYADKQDEDVEVHLLRTNGWMDTHAFPESVKVQHFCLTQVGDAKLWYESLRPINKDCNWLQNHFRQQYSKIGNTMEQLFHAWRSFHFDENTEMLDSYVTCIRQVAMLLGCGEPKVLEVFKNTLPTRLYWVLFPIEDLRQAVETANRILTKEKIDRQLVSQSPLTSFMNIKDGYNSRKVTFHMQDSSDDKIDRLMMMMSKLTVADDNQNKQFNSKIYQSKQRGQARNVYDPNNYDQRNYQNRYRSNSGDRRTSYRGRGQYGQSYRGRLFSINNYRSDFR